MARQRGPAESLRNAIGAMPHRSRVAMLEAIEGNRIIAGAYVDGRGGVCPMLAAHRNGGRTSLASFARAWDRYTSAKRARRASAREVRTLKTMLAASLVDDVDVDERDVARAIAEHRAAKARREGARPTERAPQLSPRDDTGERDRTSELSRREGWSWTRLFRRYDHYEATLRRLEELHAVAADGDPGRDEREPVGAR